MEVVVEPRNVPMGGKVALVLVPEKGPESGSQIDGTYGSFAVMDLENVLQTCVSSGLSARPTESVLYIARTLGEPAS